MLVGIWMTVGELGGAVVVVSVDEVVGVSFWMTVGEVGLFQLVK
jgi:hypothetical protein